MIEFDPHAGDPRRYGYSLAHLTELIVPCLDATAPALVAEVGAYAGDLTGVLVQWAAGRGARVLAIDPAPQPELVALAAESEQLELIRKPSLEALGELDPLPDAVIIDGDHNYYTVASELQAIADRAAAAGGPMPLLLFHDVCWPHARRDNYFNAGAIPEPDRQLVIGSAGVGLFPDRSEPTAGGLPYEGSAAHEGGPRNGVLTAVEDFVGRRDGWRLAVVPAFFGLGVAWETTAQWSADVAQILAPFDRNPILERLEAARVYHLAQGHRLQTELWQTQQRLAARDGVLRRLLESSAFAVADALSRLRVRAGVAPAQTAVSKHEIRRALSK